MNGVGCLVVGMKIKNIHTITEYVLSLSVHRLHFFFKMKSQQKNLFKYKKKKICPTFQKGISKSGID